MDLIYDIIFSIIIAIIFTLYNIYYFRKDLYNSLDEASYMRKVILYLFISFLVMFFLLRTFKGLPGGKTNTEMYIIRYIGGFMYFATIFILVDSIIH